jgi:hypothetical protein
MAIHQRAKIAARLAQIDGAATSHEVGSFLVRP